MQYPTMRYKTTYGLYHLVSSYKPRSALGLELFEIRKRFMLEEVLVKSKLTDICFTAPVFTPTYEPFMTPYLQNWATPPRITLNRYTIDLCDTGYRNRTAYPYTDTTTDQLINLCRRYVVDTMSEKTLWAWCRDHDGIIMVYVRHPDSTVCVYDQYGLCSRYPTNAYVPDGLFWQTYRELKTLLD